MALRCPNCGANLAPLARFCGTCGAGVGDKCPQCGMRLPEGAAFCSDCGMDLRDVITARERKLVTILFADISGSTGLGEKLDPEQFRDVTAAFFESTRTQIEAFGGTVEKFIGDAVMAVFGVPTAHDDDPDRALSAAQGMLESLTQLNGTLKQKHGVALSARVGINTGEVVASAPARTGMGQVAGDAVNVAARLEQAAKPGQVLIADRTVRASRRFRFRDIGPATLRGRNQPVRVHELIDSAEGPVAPLLRAPMVGREQELSLLRALFERVVQEQHPHLVTVYGEAGVGKSRLADEFGVKLQESGEAPVVLKGRCLPYGGVSTYRPLAEILKGYAGILDNDPPELVLTKIRQTALAGRESDADRMALALACTIGVETENGSFQELAPRQVEHEIQSAWRQFFTSLAARRPLVVEIEDLHWADRAMLDLLEFLADRTVGPVLFVCSARPELSDTAPGWGGGRRSFSSITLDPLPDDQAGRLVVLLLDVDDMPSAVRSEILRRAEGNPFFLEEILRHLIDEGFVVRSANRWTAAEKITQVRIPDTVQAVLAARIDLLSSAEKRALQCAAVVGRVFWAGSVASLLEVSETEVVPLLDRLESRDLILSRLETTLDGEAEYIFKHLLTRDVAFDSLSLRERTRLHLRAADWIEGTSGERRREVVEVLAYHLGQAYRGLTDDPAVPAEQLEEIRRRAFHFVLAASESARLKMALETARRYAREARQLAANPLEQAKALEALGEAYLFAYLGDGAWENLTGAIDLYLQVGHLPDRDVARVCARALEAGVRWPGAMQSAPTEGAVYRYLQIGLDHAGAVDNPERARLLTLKAFWPHAFPRPDERSHEALVPPDESLAAGEEAVAMTKRLQRADLESAALDGVEANYIAQGLYGRALEVANRRLELAQVIDDSWELGDIHAMGGWVNFHVGRYRDAFSSADMGFARTLERAPSQALYCLSWRAVSRYRLGDWDGVLADLDQGAAMLGERAGAPPHFVSPMYAAAVLVHDIRGNRAEADGILTLLRNVDKGAEPRDRDTAPLGRLAPFLAPALARRGNVDEARRLLAQTSWRRRAREGLITEAECEIAADTGAWPDAHDLVAPARAEALRCGLESLLCAVDRLEGVQALRAQRADEAVRLLERAGAGFTRLGARWDLSRAELDLARALKASGRIEEAAVVLARARAFFVEVGAAAEQQAAQELEESLSATARR